MELAALNIFWISLGVLFYTYIGYPVLMFVLGGSKRTNNANNYDLPKVSLIICAYNEEKVIAEKVQNALSCDYPSHKFEIIIVSDGSSDATNEIVSEYTDARMKFFANPNRGGKATALNTAFGNCTGEICVLTDANVMFEPNAVKKLVNNFSDDTVGAVVGNVILKSADGEIAGESLYSKYEKAVHTAENNWATMITVDGAMYAIRRKYARTIPTDTITDDWFLASRSLLDKKCMICDSQAIGYEDAAASVSGEFKRKVRMIAGGFQMMFRRMKLFFNPFAYPKISFMFISHKLLRWIAGLFMIILLLSNIVLQGTENMFYGWMLGIQVLFYLLALTGWLGKRNLTNFLFYVPYYFVAVNFASILGMLKYLTGSQKAAWEKSRE
ncbi:MAG: glycosyltransferase family 2 protein [candidate division Zixibacteria bacterium]